MTEGSPLVATLTRDHAISRNLLLLAGFIGTLAALVIGWLHPRALWWLLLFAPLLVLSLVDLLQPHHSLRRNYPASARFRWLFEWLRPFLRAYIVESDLDGRPYSHDERALVYARAKGEVDAHPFGTELDVYSDEYEWLAHSIAPSRDAPKETRVHVGTDQCSRPYQAARLNISAMSFGALGANAIEALNLAPRWAISIMTPAKADCRPITSNMAATSSGKSGRAISVAGTAMAISIPSISPIEQPMMPSR